MPGAAKNIAKADQEIATNGEQHEAAIKIQNGCWCPSERKIWTKNLTKVKPFVSLMILQEKPDE